MQATIRIEKTLIEDAMSLAGLSTQKATVEEAFRQLIRLSRQRHVRTLRGKLVTSLCRGISGCPNTSNNSALLR